MRLRHADGSLLHLAYCSNVHPADDLDGVSAQLERYTARVRERLDVPKLGIGLWVAAPALADEAAASRLAEQLDRLSLEVVTLNGFPYKAFHAPVVKRDVYWPHWAQDDRREYTLGLARLLTRLLPDDVEEGSISTLPLGWREGWEAEQQDAALRALADLAVELEELHAATGKRIRLALEPEPGCTIETIAQAVDSIAGLAPGVDRRLPGRLPSRGAVRAARGGGRAAARVGRGDRQDAGLERAARSRPGVGRGPRAAGALRRAEVPAPGARVRELARRGHRRPARGARTARCRREREWRVHFHVPVNVAEHTTQDELTATLAALAGGASPLTRHYEVETYTWSVMRDAPPDDDGLVAGLAAELEWTRDRLVALGAEVL